MSRSTYVAIVAVLALAACSSGASAPRTTARTRSSTPTQSTPTQSTPAQSTAPAVPCLAAMHPTYLDAPAGPRVALLGSGTTAVVLSNQSDEDECAWAGYAHSLASAGYAVALYDYSGDPVTDVRAVSQAVRDNGASKLVLAGASEGAKASIAAAAQVHPDAVLSLSAESSLLGKDVAPYAARLRAPTLFVTAADDPYGSTQATRGFYASAPATDKKLLVVAGRSHGTALLHNGKVATAVHQFLAHAAPAVDASTECGTGATKLSLSGPPGYRIEGLALGSGSTTAVFLHELGTASDMCGFWPYAYWLTQHYRVRAVLVNRCDVGETRCPRQAPSGDVLVRAEVGPAVDWATSHGATRIVLVGASAGGGDALEASAVLAHVDAVVDLSGDQTSTGFVAIAAARRVHVPAFMAVAAQDTICPLPGFRAQYRAVPVATKRLTVVDDGLGRHGWDLVLSYGVDLQPLAAKVAEWIAGRYG